MIAPRNASAGTWAQHTPLSAAKEIAGSGSRPLCRAGSLQTLRTQEPRAAKVPDTIRHRKKNLMSNLAGVVRLLRKEQDRLTKELRRIGAALAAFGKTYRKGTGTGRLSKSARARIAAAQRARWAKVRKAAKVVPIRGKRTLSAAARRKIAAAQRARWAKVKAGKKTA